MNQQKIDEMEKKLDEARKWQSRIARAESDLADGTSLCVVRKRQSDFLFFSIGDVFGKDALAILNDIQNEVREKFALRMKDRLIELRKQFHDL